jgi:hypothetical protein
MTNIPDNLVAKACAKVGPRLLKQLHTVRFILPVSPHSPNMSSQSSTPPEAILEGLTILSTLNARVPDEVAKLEPQPVVVFTQLLKHNRVAVRKRAIFTIGTWFYLIHF